MTRLMIITILWFLLWIFSMIAIYFIGKVNGMDEMMHLHTEIFCKEIRGEDND